MSAPTNNSCHFDIGNNAHYDHVMFALALWQTVIAALAIVVTIIFGLLNGGYLRAFQVLQRHQTQQLIKHTGGRRN